MIKFFRKIRQNLLMENKTGKYLKYAIGEVILVVIGILIALSINSWNQKRLDRQEEKEILSNLKEDYKNAAEEFKILNSLRSSFISAAKEITLINVEEIELYPEKYLDSLFGWTLYVPTFNNEAGSLSVLLNTGKINLITNTELRNILIAWPGDVADMVEDEISDNNLYNNDYKNVLSDYISVNNLTEVNITLFSRFGTPTFAKMPDNPILKSDYESILRYKKFLNLLHFRVRNFSGTYQETEYLIGKAEDIIQMIDIELD